MNQIGWHQYDRRDSRKPSRHVPHGIHIIYIYSAKVKMYRHFIFHPATFGSTTNHTSFTIDRNAAQNLIVHTVNCFPYKAKWFSYRILMSFAKEFQYNWIFLQKEKLLERIRRKTKWWQGRTKVKKIFLYEFFNENYELTKDFLEKSVKSH